MPGEKMSWSVVKSYAKQYRRDEALERPIVFVHIPKSAGLTFYRFLDALAIYRNLSRLTLSGSPLDHPTEDVILRNLKRQKLNLETFSIIGGHVPFSIINRIYTAANFITILRDPADRLISEYFANNDLTQPDPDGLLKVMRGENPPVYAVDNLQVRMLCGHPRFGQPCTGEMLAEAKQNLEERLLFGTVDEIEKFLSIFLTIFELPTVIYEPSNINVRKPTIDENSSMYEVAANFNRLDFDLYQWARGQFRSVKNTYLPESTCHFAADKKEVIQVTEDACLTVLRCYSRYMEDPEEVVDIDAFRNGVLIQHQARFVNVDPHEMNEGRKMAKVVDICGKTVGPGRPIYSRRNWHQS